MPGLLLELYTSPYQLMVNGAMLLLFGGALISFLLSSNTLRLSSFLVKNQAANSSVLREWKKKDPVQVPNSSTLDPMRGGLAALLLLLLLLE